MEKLVIIGYGPGGEALLTDEAKTAISNAGRVLNTREMPLSDLLAKLGRPVRESTAVLVSGDSGFFSVTKTIIKEYSELYEIKVTPGVGSIQYLSAKIKKPYDDAVLVSLHGRDCNIVPKTTYNKKVFALTGGEGGVGEICRKLCRYGLGDVTISVGERLSYPDERLVTGKARELQDMDFDGLSVMYIENPSAADPHMPLNDADFIRADIPMTKEEIRWLSIQKLGVRPGDVVFDIGAGTGAV